MVAFAYFVGREEARLALMLNAIEPRCGGVLFVGKKGTGKTTLARLLPTLLPPGTPFLNVPLNVTEDALLGAIDLEATMQSGQTTFQEGILDRGHGGVVFVDDINLLSSEALACLFEVHDRGANIVQREGFSRVHDARFLLLATMNPEEGALSPHFIDRFGMCVAWDELPTKEDRLLLLKRIARTTRPHGGRLNAGDDALRNRVLSCRRSIAQIRVSDAVLGYIAKTCEENGVSSHRAELFLYHGARAYAAYCGDAAAQTRHVDSVAPLVLFHRRPSIVQRQSSQTSKPSHEKDDGNPPPKEQRDEPNEAPSRPSVDDVSGASRGGNGEELSEPVLNIPTRSTEEVFETGEPFRVRRFLLKRDRIKRTLSGRRTRTRSKDRGGRYIRSMMLGENDIAIDATIRAAAPQQKKRRRCDSMVIHAEDIRYKQREKKTGHLVVFAVDGSGSMGAQKRMVESKGAVQSLLADCYLKRDKVAMVVFRKDRAEVVLPPTSSVELASRALKAIPTGGKTPLSSGLLECYYLIQRYAKKAPETRFLLILVTDGRANHAITDASPRQEAFRVARLLGQLPRVDAIVVDTENKTSFLKADLALSLAENLGADYYTMSDLKAEYLFDLAARDKTHA